jgi:UDP-2-acetamido-3-amino-2,3-dideoxy-glucuronate N-acetyltransferase
MRNKIKVLEGVFIHMLSEVYSKEIGVGSKLWQWSLIFPGAKIGVNCNICAHTLVENDVIIGNDVTVKSGVFLWDGLRVENEVFIGPNASFTNDLYPRSKKQPKTFPQTLLKNGCSIGANATILCGITIGENSMVGAGSVVTKDVPSNSLVLGNPARVQGDVSLPE